MSAETFIKLVRHRAVDEETAAHVVAGLSTCKWHRFCAGRSLARDNAATILRVARSFDPRVLAVRDRAGRLLPLPDTELESLLSRIAESDAILARERYNNGRCG